jgi:valyl-tRNA synthetase
MLWRRVSQRRFVDNTMEYPKPILNIDDLPKRYGGIEREKFWQDWWMASGIYNYDPDQPRDNVYSVDTPPPTVSGALHIGHVFSYTQTDFSVRFQRMHGRHIFYPFGFDDNGLPSERLVERITGKRAHEVGREEFIRLCEPILKDAEKEFTDLWQSLALSCDWSQFYTTINERSRAISQASFIDLYNRGYIYRKEAPTQWCWADQTAIAQAEIEDKEVAGHFHDITFHIDDGSGTLQPVTIATTRPELIPACVAVFAHPDDERYKHLFGKKAITPLFEVEVPILPSVKADPEKGTGILMCCTFGDQDDVEHWQQFNLPTRVVITREGRMEDIGGRFVGAGERSCALDTDKYDNEEQQVLGREFPSRNPEKASALAGEMAGQKIKAAREWIRGQLSEAGLMTKVEDITHIVRHSERGGVPIEILVTPQWYINLLEHKAELIEQGRKVKWHPEWMLKRYEHWVDGLNQDWCISRQRYNGVPFPVWYDADGNIVLAEIDQLPVNPLVDKPVGAEQRSARDGAGDGSDGPSVARPLLASGLTPEADVMDTWATSSVTPLLNTHLVLERDDAGIVQTTPRHDGIFPYDLRPQAHDIIRTWAFYTIAKSFYHFGEIPWKHIVISGHAQDAGRKKISKSKGHVVTPAEMVEKYTADGLRYWASSCKLGTDTIYDEDLLGEGKKLVNKLFNATKFALRHLLDFKPPMDGDSGRPDLAALVEMATYPTDRWMLDRLGRAIDRATKAHTEYEFGDALATAEDFFWADFCDNYLELSKGRLYGDETVLGAHPDADPAALRTSAQASLFLALGGVLKLFAPVLPHVCEECWSWYHAQFCPAESIHTSPWPPTEQQVVRPGDAEAGTQLVQLVALVRKWKSERSVSIKKPVARLTVYPGAAADKPGNLEQRESVLGDLLGTTNSLTVVVEPGEPPTDAARIEGNPYAVNCELAEEA